MSDPLPQPPDPVKVAQWSGQIRTLIAVLAGVGFGGAALKGISSEQITGWVTAAMTLWGIGAWAWVSWKSWQAKKADRKILVASTVASVKLNTPVAVTVTPEGQPNIATRISTTEQIAAPTVPADVPPQPPLRGGA
jgi:hypothetical protein